MPLKQDDVITYTDTLDVMECPACGVTYGLSSVYRAQRRKDSRSWNCPNGHSLSYGNANQTEKERLEARLQRTETDAARQRARADQQQARADHQAAVARGYKGAMVRTKKRAAKGICPVPGCKRSFVNVARHVEGQHPEWVAEHNHEVSA